MSHTLGPWTVHDSGHIVASDEHRTIVATVGNIHNPSIAADARLLSAAPDLLEALKAAQFGLNHRRCVVCAGWKMSPQGETDTVHTPDCIVGKALAKAESR